MALAGHNDNNLACLAMHSDIKDRIKDLYVLQDKLVNFEGIDVEEEEVLFEKISRKYNNLKRRISNIERSIEYTKKTTR